MRPDTCFVHDRRFERFHRGGLGRHFAGYLYWHLKYLKRGGWRCRPRCCPGKSRLLAARNAAFVASFAQHDLAQALDASSPGWRAVLAPCIEAAE